MAGLDYVLQQGFTFCYGVFALTLYSLFAVLDGYIFGNPEKWRLEQIAKGLYAIYLTCFYLQD
jgi:hypothetical protein